MEVDAGDVDVGDELDVVDNSDETEQIKSDELETIDEPMEDEIEHEERKEDNESIDPQ